MNKVMFTTEDLYNQYETVLLRSELNDWIEACMERDFEYLAEFLENPPPFQLPVQLAPIWTPESREQLFVSPRHLACYLEWQTCICLAWGQDKFGRNQDDNNLRRIHGEFGIQFRMPFDKNTVQPTDEWRDLNIKVRSMDVTNNWRPWIPIQMYIVALSYDKLVSMWRDSRREPFRRQDGLGKLQNRCIRLVNTLGPFIRPTSPLRKLIRPVEPGGWSEWEGVQKYT